MRNMQLWCPLLAAFALLGCDGQQYVSPDTVLLTVSHDVTGSKLLERCNYVPVLLGGRVDRHYVVDGALQATIALTRSDIVVTFQGAGDGFEPFHVAPKRLEDSTSVVDEYSPTGYTAELSPGCVPDDE
jgi:hypothetical protein